MKIFENLFELSKGALPVCLVPSKKPTTKFLTLNSCWKVYVTFQYFAHFLSRDNHKSTQKEKIQQNEENSKDQKSSKTSKLKLKKTEGRSPSVFCKSKSEFLEVF